jgi:hypothetical protein
MEQKRMCRFVDARHQRDGTMENLSSAGFFFLTLYL